MAGRVSRASEGRIIKRDIEGLIRALAYEYEHVNTRQVRTGVKCTSMPFKVRKPEERQPGKQKRRNL